MFVQQATSYSKLESAQKPGQTSMYLKLPSMNHEEIKLILITLELGGLITTMFLG